MPAKRFGWMVAAILPVLFLIAASFTPATASASPLRVHFIDVGQGDGIYVESPLGATVLIDGGYDNGKALAYVQRLQVTRLEAIILTHPHADHVGGLVQVMRVMPVGEVWTSGAATTTGIYERFLDLIAQKKTPYHEAASGTVITVGDVAFNVLYSQEKAANLNNASIVMRLQYGIVSFLSTGDAEQPVANALLASARDKLPSTILKVGHHGSSTSSSPAFLSAVKPQIAVYSAGRGNSCGHPHQATIDNLKAIGAIIYGTDVHGTVIISTDGTTYQITTTTNAPPIAGASSVSPQTSSTTPSPTTAAYTGSYDPHGPDRDCSDFATQAEAQAFFIAAGGPHHLDGDHDGIPCEDLP